VDDGLDRRSDQRLRRKPEQPPHGGGLPADAKIASEHGDDITRVLNQRAQALLAALLDGPHLLGQHDSAAKPGQPKAERRQHR
jgi:hypothetical protein